MRFHRLKLLLTPEGRKEWAIDLRHWAKFYPKHAGAVVLAILLGLGWVWDNLVGRSVQVIDGSTGRPLEGVYAIWRWKGHALPLSIQAVTSCYRIRVARTDEDGRYRIPYWSWTIWAVLAIDRGSGSAYYHPGYYEESDPEARREGHITLWPDPSSVQDRLMEIRRDQSGLQCAPFDDEEQRRELGPVYEAMTKEAEAIAVTSMHRISSDSVRFTYNILRFGTSEASRIERELEGRTK